MANISPDSEFIINAEPPLAFEFEIASFNSLKSLNCKFVSNVKDKLSLFPRFIKSSN